MSIKCCICEHSVQKRDYDVLAQLYFCIECSPYKDKCWETTSKERFNEIFDVNHSFSGKDCRIVHDSQGPIAIAFRDVYKVRR